MYNLIRQELSRHLTTIEGDGPNHCNPMEARKHEKEPINGGL